MIKHSRQCQFYCAKKVQQNLGKQKHMRTIKHINNDQHQTEKTKRPDINLAAKDVLERNNFQNYSPLEEMKTSFLQLLFSVDVCLHSPELIFSHQHSQKVATDF